MVRTLFAVVLLTAAATPPARPADYPTPGLQAKADPTADLSAMIKKLNVQIEASEKLRDEAREARKRAAELKKRIEELTREEPKDEKKDPKTGDNK